MTIHSLPVIGGLPTPSYDITQQQELEDQKLEKIASLYAQAFANSPWNEYKKCPKGHYFGKDVSESAATCLAPNCTESLSLYYPLQETKTYITQEMAHLNGTLFTCEKNADVVGAGWGFSYQPEEFATEKYKTLPMQEKIIALFKEKNGEGPFFYISEVMVDQGVRKNGIATKIATALTKRAQELAQNIIMRTSVDSPMALIGSKLYMEEILTPGADEEHDKRIIFFREHQSG